MLLSKKLIYNRVFVIVCASFIHYFYVCMRILWFKERLINLMLQRLMMKEVMAA